MVVSRVRATADRARRVCSDHIAPLPLEIPRQIAHYRIESRLGSGGMGDVYRATDIRLGRAVALKVIRQSFANDPKIRRRFSSEASAASAVSHQNVAALYEVGEQDGVAYMATELVRGTTLREALAAGSMPVDELLKTAVQLAEALAAVHEAGVIHRDVSPSNVMITVDGAVKLVDFGLATRNTPSSDGSSIERETSEVSGTLGYMSPEQARGGAVDFRSDQFSFGAILYEMATGRRAFWRETAIESLVAVVNDQPEAIGTVVPGFPPALEATITRCLAKSADQRYASTEQLARELRSIRDRHEPAEMTADPLTTGSWPSFFAAVLGIAVSRFLPDAGGRRRR
jgi:serine/threonine protein kinase